MKLFILVLGMVLILEGMPYAAAPEKMRDWLVKLSKTPTVALRIVGFVSLGTGFLICWAIQRTTMFM